MRYRERKFTGCWTCRSRKVKCDEAKPSCRHCVRHGRLCEGYSPKLIWVVNSDAAQPKTDGRRLIRCGIVYTLGWNTCPDSLLVPDRTWNGYRLLSSEEVDALIFDTDEALTWDQNQVKSNHVLAHGHESPFSIFRLQTTRNQSARYNGEPVGRSPADQPDLSWTERYLFNHYVNHVAHLMMPYHHSRSPWMALYPRIALRSLQSENKSLYHSVIAHSAFNLKQLKLEHDEIASVGAQNYASAVRCLLADTSRTKSDSGMAFAAVMTLMMAEIYLGQAKTWKHHRQGAFALMTRVGIGESWQLNDFTCVLIQSLAIINILGNSASRPSSRIPSSSKANITWDSQSLLSLTPSRKEFGFTVGASRDVLECIEAITALETRLEQDGNYESIEADLPMILLKLKASHELEVLAPEPKSGTEPTTRQSHHQRMSFVYATYVYLYRTIFAATPQRVRSHVSKTLQHVTAFFETSSGNFSIWPAFIAAAEAYTEEDVVAARSWLQRSTTFGMGNRKQMCAVIEEVWRRRRLEATQQHSDPGSIVVDWREVMQELDCDILLV